ncbi:MAG: DUF29 domain-containing protein [Cyanothece sp. SIO2G6]|nr:DUF29 domain-containing protein [Cyanothece sp. SIO2G6]
MVVTYDTDLVAWANHTAQLLRQQRWADVDWEHLIAEVEDLGKSERSAIASQLERVLLHLLKWEYQLQRRSDSWLDSITDGRSQIQRKIEDSPSLKSYPSQVLAKEYQRARRQAAKQTGLAIATFPADCPYPLDQLLEDWMPT